MVPLLALPEGGEWIVLLVIVLLLFGSKKLPELTRNSARALVEFRKVASGKDDDDSKAETAEAPPQAEVRQPQAEVSQPQAEVGQPQAEVSAERPPRTTADNPPQT
jgi:sec-independent protein translocase protein TatA